MAEEEKVVEELTTQEALTDPLYVPEPVDGAAAHIKSFPAAPEFQEKLGYPGERPDNWQEVALNKMQDLRGKFRSFRLFLDICVKCGACTDKCHYFMGTADPKNMPVARADLIRSVYRRYFTLPGKWFPSLVGARELTEEVLDEWYTYYFQCSECRRCSVYCPYGIDTAEITMAAREILDSVGVGMKYTNEIIGKVYDIGNNLGLQAPALKATMEDLEEEIEEDTGVKVRIPVDEPADILLIPPSADFFAEPHIDGFIGYAKVFHAAGVKWTISTYASEAANFAMFIGSYENMRRIAQRIRREAIRLGVKRIIIGECGHAWRAAYQFLNTLAGPFDFLDPNYPVPQHICEFTWDLIQEGKLRFDKSQNDHLTLTFHDSCNVARASRMGKYPGGQFDIPRNIIKAVCNNYYDMPEDTIKEATLCCGGGGGLLTDDLMELRKKGGSPRMKALKQVTEEYGVNKMAAICAICKTQFSKIMPYNGYAMDDIMSVHQLVSNAIVLPGSEQEAELDGTADESGDSEQAKEDA